MRGPTFILLATASFALSGCLAKTALDVATAPVRVASKAVDMATTSQSEADEKRGRELRKQDEERESPERGEQHREGVQQVERGRARIHKEREATGRAIAKHRRIVRDHGKPQPILPDRGPPEVYTAARNVGAPATVSNAAERRVNRDRMAYRSPDRGDQP